MEKRSILALDPISSTLYRYNLDTHCVKFEKEYTEKAKETIQKELKMFEHLCGFDITG